MKQNLPKASEICLMLHCTRRLSPLVSSLAIFVYSALSEEEKTSLRAGLITNFNEPVNQVSGEKKRDMWWGVGFSSRLPCTEI